MDFDLWTPHFIGFLKFKNSCCIIPDVHSLVFIIEGFCQSILSNTAVFQVLLKPLGDNVLMGQVSFQLPFQVGRWLIDQ